ncbi:unnamed protein product [Phaedon cochleariae]|uniref:Apolipoprotein D n=1 Tax=Phaedon cochleariae TaxID=80249 RepID=A0A9P0GHM0_PHACE|nr:unnamed protein product [Phaedon cochleariae]
MKMIIFAFALAFLAETYAQVPSFSCPDVSVVQNFQPSKYAGTWYEQKKYPFIFEIGGKCITAEYSLNPNGTVGVLNQQINVLTGKPSSIQGSARLDSTTGEGKLLVNFPSVPFNVDAPYWILATDYERYAVVWSCTKVPLIGSTRNAWILTRERNPAKHIIDEALSVFEKQDLSTNILKTTDQENC